CRNPVIGGSVLGYVQRNCKTFRPDLLRRGIPLIVGVIPDYVASVRIAGSDIPPSRAWRVLFYFNELQSARTCCSAPTTPTTGIPARTGVARACTTSGQRRLRRYNRDISKELRLSRAIQTPQGCRHLTLQIAEKL